MPKLTPDQPNQRIDSLHPPFVIRMMLAFYCRRDNPEADMWPGAFNSPMGVVTLDNLHTNGLITAQRELTEKGRDWIRKSLSVPFQEARP